MQYQTWRQCYSNEECDRITSLASEIAKGKNPDAIGASAEDYKQATKIVRQARR